MLGKNSFITLYGIVDRSLSNIPCFTNPYAGKWPYTEKQMEDDTAVVPYRCKSISCETTFEIDITDYSEWKRLCR